MDQHLSHDFFQRAQLSCIRDAIRASHLASFARLGITSHPLPNVSQAETCAMHFSSMVQWVSLNHGQELKGH